ncbi:MAG: hypothetical protein LBS40_02195 [Burkholderiales bacterium]|nr:hypothetical protein [Burkholderiales bacterium]
MNSKRFFSYRVAVVLAALLVSLSGCVSLAEDDPRSSNRHELWWLGAKNPNQMIWPARTIEELQPMPVESLPERAMPPVQSSPNWPPL